MSIQNGNPVPLKDAVRENTDIARFSEKIRTGALPVSSTKMDTLSSFTQEETDTLHRTLMREMARINDKPRY